MLAPRKRLTRKQIKEDKLVTMYGKATDYINENSKLLIGAAVLIILVFVGIWAIRSSRMAEEANASLELARGKTAYDEGDYIRAIDILRRAVEDYGGSKSGALAGLYLANSLYETEEFEEAERYYRIFSDKMSSNGLLASSGLAGIAACLEHSENYAEAAKYYLEAAEKYPKEIYADRYLLDAGRCFMAADQSAEALNTLESLVEKYPESANVRTAEQYIAELKSGELVISSEN